MAVRKFLLAEALHSYTKLIANIAKLTQEEVLEAIQFESETRRRTSIMRRLIGRAARLNEQEYVNSLKRKYTHA